VIRRFHERGNTEMAELLTELELDDREWVRQALIVELEGRSS
jgi:hypothetical protein